MARHLTSVRLDPQHIWLLGVVSAKLGTSRSSLIRQALYAVLPGWIKALEDLEASDQVGAEEAPAGTGIGESVI